MLMNVLDSLSNLREYFQYFSLVHRLVALCQILCQRPANKQQQFQISSNTDPENDIIIPIQISTINKVIIVAYKVLQKKDLLTYLCKSNKSGRYH